MIFRIQFEMSSKALAMERGNNFFIPGFYEDYQGQGRQRSLSVDSKDVKEEIEGFLETCGCAVIAEPEFSRQDVIEQKHLEREERKKKQKQKEEREQRKLREQGQGQGIAWS